MIEKAIQGGKSYYSWLALLVGIMLIGAYYWVRQFTEGLGITGLSRDVTWGFYIAQFTFLVGVAASAVMVVLPYYLHNFKAFGKITILGEFLAIGAVLMCMSFIFVDMGQPFRILNVFLHPSPHSMMFWDTVVLFGYLLLNILISSVSMQAEKKGVAPPKWIKPFIILSIPWAFSIHTVTAMLYSGLAARPFWMTAVLGPRFLASAFAAGPALLILLAMLLRRLSKFDAGDRAINQLAMIITYALGINLFFVAMELFTAFYSGIPEHISHFKYLFVGLEGNNFLVGWMWVSMLLGVSAFVLLVNPKTRKNYKVLAFACVAVFVSLWIEKGLGLVITGFIPSPLGEVVSYVPTLPEVMIGLAIWALGAFVVTVLYKMTLNLRERWG
ncbi:menaquinol oxidoreductase [bacterium]|nr:menaquinol oxidoreductase [bacterium]